MTHPLRPGVPANEERIEAARRVLMADPVPWDELRQRRVLANIDAALDAKLDPSHTVASTSSRSRRGAVVAVIGAAVAVAAAVVAVLWLSPLGAGPGADDRGIAIADEPAPVADPSRPAIPFAQPPTMALADGSLAELHDGARVDVDVQTAELVRLDQRSGTVRYEVAKNPARSFVVDASGVEVRVIGTIFTVAYAGEAHVEVSVERGLVQVAAADRIARLGAGDSLRLEVVPEPDEFVIIEDDAGEDTTVVGMARRRGKARRGKEPTSTEDGGGNPEGPSLDALLAESDEARAAGDLPRAATALRQLVTRFPKNSQAVSASFQLGNVERRRGRHAAAASAFAACIRRSPRGTLAEDARAESAQAWADAGRGDKAAAAARAYLDRYPNGTHAARMQRIVDRSE